MPSQILPALSPDQQDALLRRLRRTRTAPVAPAAVTPDAARHSQPFPLTEIQQAYWVGRQATFELGNVSAHAYLEVDCRGLDLPRLEAALRQVIDRHGMLRAVIDADGRQRILPEVPPYRIAVEDVSGCSAEAQQLAVQATRAELSHQVLPADRWPLFDIRATRLGEGRYRMHLSLDILILDAHSFDQVIAPEWAAFYADPDLKLAALEFSFADYVVGIQRREESPAFAQALNYWRERLDSLPSAPEFALATRPESVQRPQFVHRSMRLVREQWQALRSAGGARGVTPANVLLAAYALVVGRWSGCSHFTLNLTLFNRLPFHPDVERLVGDFTTSTLLEINLRPLRSFAELARAIQQQLWQDLDHRAVSGVRVMRELAEQRRSGPPSFPVVFTGALNNGLQAEGRSVLGWMGEVCHAVTQTPQVWLDCQTVEDAGDLVVDWDSLDDLFEPGFVDAMFEGFSELVHELATRASVWESVRLDLLPAAQRALIAASNATRAPHRELLLHEPLLAQCRARPSALAVADARRNLSFGRLYAESNALAHAILAAGIPGGALVGVMLPKGAEQVVAVLGILEAGGAYLPIDPELPLERIQELLRLSGARALVTDGVTHESRAAGAALPCFLIDELVVSTPRPLPPLRTSRDLAYVIYTSGSTGTPKGVAIDHRGALNTCDDCNQRFAIAPEDRVLGLSALNFDLSVWDIFGVLGAGGALVLPDPGRAREPAHWAEMMRRHRVTVWNTVPALLDLYVGYLRDVAGARDDVLRLAMMSGDWIALGLPAQIREQCPNAAIYSLGGATEASIWSILYPVGEVDPAWRSIPYGTPMRNQTFHVRDAHLDPCPVGVPGELCIGGIGVALGYWNDQVRSDVQFVVCPHTGERLYRTGDLGRRLPDGQLEILGRIDFQVKINGYRVELGEIEAILSSLPEVRGAVAHVIGGVGQPKRLIGYYVREHDDTAQDVAKLRARLSCSGMRQLEGPAVVLPGAAVPAPTRRSVRDFQQAPVPLERLAGMLAPLRPSGAEGIARYAYASGGGLYPVQAYVHVDAGRVAGLEAGLYYFHPGHNALQLVDSSCVLQPQWVPSANRPVVAGAAFRVFLVASRQAIEPHYGQEAVLPLCTLEAGAISQLLEDAAVREGLGAVQLGGFRADRAGDLFRMGLDAVFLHLLVGGWPAAPTVAPATTSDADFESGLREQLASRLPEYMVPRQFMRIESIPLSSNGKVDRRALPEPESQRAAAPLHPPAMAETPLSKEIQALWMEVLERPVGLDDNLFDLGGTSVDMIRIHTRLAPRLPRPVSVVDMFFTFPTIGDLMRHLAPPENGPIPEKRARNRRRRSR